MQTHATAPNFVVCSLLGRRITEKPKPIQGTLSTRPSVNVTFIVVSSNSTCLASAVVGTNARWNFGFDSAEVLMPCL